MAEPTIQERLRRLHQLYTAEANALAASELADARRLAERCRRLAEDELTAIEAAAADRGCTREAIARFRVELVEMLRTAVRHQVRLGIAQTAFRAAEKSGAIVPKSQLVEVRGWMRGAARTAENEAQQALRAVLDALQITEEDLNSE